jgi:hypothetical protein
MLLLIVYYMPWLVGIRRSSCQSSSDFLLAKYPSHFVCPPIPLPYNPFFLFFLPDRLGPRIMSQTPELQLLSRADLTRLACDALAAEGKKPSIGMVREWTIANAGGKKGSDGDVQKDINGWFDDLLKLKRDKSIADLPDAVAALARDVWRMAVDVADDTLAGERQAMAAQLAQAADEVARAGALARQADERVLAVEQELAVANETIAARADMIVRLDADLAGMKSVVDSRDERIAGLTMELARKAEDQAAGLAELSALRKHSLVQIDQARLETQEWKAEVKRVEKERGVSQAAHQKDRTALETELAAMQGKLAHIQQELDAAKARNLALEISMAAGTPSASSTSPHGASLRARERVAQRGENGLRTKLVARRRK